MKAQRSKNIKYIGRDYKDSSYKKDDPSDKHLHSGMTREPPMEIMMKKEINSITELPPVIASRHRLQVLRMVVDSIYLDQNSILYRAQGN